MANSATIEETISLGGTSYMYIGTLTVTGTYATGGEAIDLGSNERISSFRLDSGVYTHKWDAAAQKLLFYYADYDAVADGAFIQVANGATHTSASGATFVAIGQ